MDFSAFLDDIVHLPDPIMEKWPLEFGKSTITGSFPLFSWELELGRFHRFLP